MVLQRSGRSDELSAPGIVALERLVEIEDFRELVPRVRRLTHEQLELDQREDDVADVARVVDPPVLEDEPRQHAEAVERQVATGEGELAPTDVAALRKALLAELQRAQHEQVGALVEALLAHADAIH